ncbi:hypothetical protein GMRT_14205 [Giardia muris]|uniref:Uncharacterized protein n=1 Tax=Giardia muris TaxID=5742 RepID=A0A4Z1SX10_GIAMU|nr:hypothetical protein GMRT_14205 [Giardia muris]|eukprot:TNJ30256.1 hypothetical protein GMRT_14205 [Giardia muris]
MTIKYTDIGVASDIQSAAIAPQSGRLYCLATDELICINTSEQIPKLQWTFSLADVYTDTFKKACTSFLSRLTLSTRAKHYMKPCLSLCEHYLIVAIKSPKRTASIVFIFNVESDEVPRHLRTFEHNAEIVAIIRDHQGSDFLIALPNGLIRYQFNSIMKNYDQVDLDIQSVLTRGKTRQGLSGMALLPGSYLLVMDDSLYVLNSDLLLGHHLTLECTFLDVRSARVVTREKELNFYLVLGVLARAQGENQPATCVIHVLKQIPRRSKFSYNTATLTIPMRGINVSDDFSMLQSSFSEEGAFLNVVLTGSASDPFVVSLSTEFEDKAVITPAFLPVYYDAEQLNTFQQKGRNKIVLEAHVTGSDMATVAPALAVRANEANLFSRQFLDLLTCTDMVGDANDNGDGQSPLSKVISVSMFLSTPTELFATTFREKSVHAARKLMRESEPGISSVQQAEEILKKVGCLNEPTNETHELYQYQDFYSYAVVFACIRFSQLRPVLLSSIKRRDHREHLQDIPLTGLAFTNDTQYTFPNIRPIIYIVDVVLDGCIKLVQALADRSMLEDDEVYRLLRGLCNDLQPIMSSATGIISALYMERVLSEDLTRRIITLELLGDAVSNSMSLLYFISNMRTLCRTPFPLTCVGAEKMRGIARISEYSGWKNNMHVCTARSQAIASSQRWSIQYNTKDETLTYFNCDETGFALLAKSIAYAHGQDTIGNLIYTRELGYFGVDNELNYIRMEPHHIPDYKALYSVNNKVGNTAIWSIVRYLSFLGGTSKDFVASLLYSREYVEMHQEGTPPGLIRMTIAEALKTLTQTYKAGMATASGRLIGQEQISSTAALLTESGVHACRIFIIYCLLMDGQDGRTCLDACYTLCRIQNFSTRGFIYRTVKVPMQDGISGTTTLVQQQEYYARCIYLAARIIFSIDTGYAGTLDGSLKDVGACSDQLLLNQLMDNPSEADFIGIQLLTRDMHSDLTITALRRLLFHALSFLPYSCALDNATSSVSHETVEKSSKMWAGRLCHLALLRNLTSLAWPLAMSSLESAEENHIHSLWPAHPGSAKTELMLRSCLIFSVFTSLQKPPENFSAQEHQRHMERLINRQMAGAVYQLRKDLNKIVSEDTCVCFDVALGLRLCYIFAELATNQYRIEELYKEMNPELLASSASDHLVEPMPRFRIDLTKSLGHSGIAGAQMLLSGGSLRVDQLVDGGSEVSISMTKHPVPIYCKLINYSPITRVEISAVTTFCLYHPTLFSYLLRFLLLHNIREGIQFFEVLQVIENTDSRRERNQDRSLHECILAIKGMKAQMPGCITFSANEQPGGETLSISRLTLSAVTRTGHQGFDMRPQLHLPYNLSEAGKKASNGQVPDALSRSFLSYDVLDVTTAQQDALTETRVLRIPQAREMGVIHADATQPLFILKRVNKPMQIQHQNPFGQGYEEFNALPAQQELPYNVPGKQQGLAFEIPSTNTAIQRRAQGTVGIPIRRMNQFAGVSNAGPQPYALRQRDAQQRAAQIGLRPPVRTPAAPTNTLSPTKGVDVPKQPRPAITGYRKPAPQTRFGVTPASKPTMGGQPQRNVSPTGQEPIVKQSPPVPALKSAMKTRTRNEQLAKSKSVRFMDERTDLQEEVRKAFTGQ